MLNALAKLSRQNITKLVEQWSRRDYRVMPDTVFHKVAAETARQERGDQHVRIQEEFHEMRLNTSSSVKMP